METEALQLIEELNSRQDQALSEIDQLNARIETLIEVNSASNQEEADNATLNCGN